MTQDDTQNNRDNNAFVFSRDSRVQATCRLHKACQHSPTQSPHCSGIFLLSWQTRRSSQQQSPPRRWTSLENTEWWTQFLKERDRAIYGGKKGSKKKKIIHSHREPGTTAASLLTCGGALDQHSPKHYGADRRHKKPHHEHELRTNLDNLMHQRREKKNAWASKYRVTQQDQSRDCCHILTNLPRINEPIRLQTA